MRTWRLAKALTREARHPVWGEIFQRVITRELRAEDVFFAGEIEDPPMWLAAVGGANLEALPEVADLALSFFLSDTAEECEGLDHLEKALYLSITQNRGEWENSHPN